MGMLESCRWIDLHIMFAGKWVSKMVVWVHAESDS